MWNLLDRDKTEATGLECERQRQGQCPGQHSILESVLECTVRRVNREMSPHSGMTGDKVLGGLSE